MKIEEERRAGLRASLGQLAELHAASDPKKTALLRTFPAKRFQLQQLYGGSSQKKVE
jgi:hypothetical protein